MINNTFIRSNKMTERDCCQRWYDIITHLDDKTPYFQLFNKAYVRADNFQKCSSAKLNQVNYILIFIFLKSMIKYHRIKKSIIL